MRLVIPLATVVNVHETRGQALMFSASSGRALVSLRICSSHSTYNTVPSDFNERDSLIIQNEDIVIADLGNSIRPISPALSLPLTNC